MMGQGIHTVLVTGGAGFIGSNFVHYVLSASPDCVVVNMDKLTYAGNLENLAGLGERYPGRYLFLKGDIADRAFVENLFEQRDIDAVVNFAAESHVDRSILDPAIFVETNVLGTATLLNAARATWQVDAWSSHRFLQVSTDEVYGSLPEDDLEAKFTETTPLKPHSPYSASKASADLLVQAYHDTYGLPTLITRCSNNFGPRQFPEKLIPLMIRNALRDESLPVYGDGKNVRDWIHVDDHNDAVWRVLTAGTPGEVYNIGADNERRNIEIVELLLDLLGKPRSLIRFVEDRLGHDRRYAIDASKLRRELGWSSRHTFEEELGDTVQWYLDNQDWIDHVVTGEYLEFYDRLYSGR